MRAVIQRVSKASVKVGNQIIASISQGLLILIGLRSWRLKKILNG